MKKIGFIAALFLLTVALFAATNKADAPKKDHIESVSDIHSPNWPFGPATSSLLEQDDTVNVTISNTMTLLNFGTLDSTMRLVITPASGLKTGALLVIKAKSDLTARNITLSGALPTSMAGTISKTKVQTFIYNGSSFIATSGIVQLD